LNCSFRHQPQALAGSGRDRPNFRLRRDSRAAVCYGRRHVRLLGDFDLAEEAIHEGFKAIDTLRRRARLDGSQDELVRYLEAQSSSGERPNEEDSLEDAGCT